MMVNEIQIAEADKTNHTDAMFSVNKYGLQ